jgi:hypothetical protein
MERTEVDTSRGSQPKAGTSISLERHLDNCIMSRAQLCFWSSKTANVNVGGVLRGVSGS